MTEARQVHAVARKYLAPYGRLERLEHRFALGWPDCYYVLRRVSGWLEEKIIQPSGRPPGHLTLDQVLWAEREVAAGGRWHLLGRCGPEWWLMTAAQTRVWFDGASAEPLVRVTGRFPLREVLDAIAPLPPPREDVGRQLLDCAQYDATMGGPVFKGWNRSRLDTLRRSLETQ